MTPDTKQVEPLTEAEVTELDPEARGFRNAMVRVNEARLLATVRALQQRDAQLLVMREALEQVEAILDGAVIKPNTGNHVAEALIVDAIREAQRALFSTSQLASEVKERIERPLREQLRELAEWQLEVAEGTGYINRAEGQAGYEVAPAQTIVDALKRASDDANTLRDYVNGDESDLLEEDCPFCERSDTGVVPCGFHVQLGVALAGIGVERERAEKAEAEVTSLRTRVEALTQERDAALKEATAPRSEQRLADERKRADALSAQYAELARAAFGLLAVGGPVAVPRTNARVALEAALASSPDSALARVEALTRERDLEAAHLHDMRTEKERAESERDALSAKCAELEKTARELTGLLRIHQSAGKVVEAHDVRESLDILDAALASSPDSALARVEAKIREESWRQALEWWIDHGNINTTVKQAIEALAAEREKRTTTETK